MKSLLSQGAPFVLRGLLLEYLGDIDMKVLQQYVETDTSLWSLIEPANQAKLKNLCASIKDKTWLTSEWLLNSGRERIAKLRDTTDQNKQYERLKLCALMSYFFNSPKASVWLDRQACIIRTELSH